MPRSIPPIARRRAAVCIAVALLAWSLPAQAQVLRSNLWIPDGPVNAEVVVGNTLYVGGDFSAVGPAVGGWAQIDSTGKSKPPAPLVAGTVYCSTPDGNGGWYLGGEFDAVSTQWRTNLAHIDGNGIVKAWAPTMNGPVYALLLFAGRLYAGGGFTTAGGLARNHLAVFDTLSGNVGKWNPGTDGDVHVLTPFGSTFLVGGQFAHLGGLVRANLAGVDTAGAVWAWDPEPNGAVYALGVIHRTVPNVVTVYAGGEFTILGGQARNNFGAVDATDGSASFSKATTFNPNANAAVRSIVIRTPLTPTFYVGGDFGNIGGQPRANLAAINGSGVATSWNPGVGGVGSGRAVTSVDALALNGTTLYVGGTFGSLGGQLRANLGAVDTGTGAATAWDPRPDRSVYTLGLDGQGVHAGGSFAIVHGVARGNLAAFDLASGEATGWNPGADDRVYALQNVGGRIYAGGEFANMGGVAHAHIVQLDPATGAPGAWAPAPAAAVRCIASRPTGGGFNLVYFGGDFTSVAGLPRRHLAAMSDGLNVPGLNAWDPSADSTVSALAVSGTTVYAGGMFQHVGGQARNYAAALDATTGAAVAWNPGPDAPVAALALSGTRVYAGGAFANVGGTAHRGVVAVDATSGSVQSWPAQVIGPVSAVAATSSAVYVGGVFTHVGAASQTNLAALDPSTGAAENWSPEPWTPLDPSTLLLVQPEVRALTASSGCVYAGGVFATILRSPHAWLAGMFEAMTGVDDAPPLAVAPAIVAMPNPSRGGVSFDLRVPHAGALELRVYDVAGHLVRDLGAPFAAAGDRHVPWDGRDAGGRAVPAGVYLARARSAAWQASGRVVRVR